MTTLRFNVTGMTCAACSARVEAAIRRLPGVSDVAVGLLTNSARVEGDVEPSAVVAAVERAGYRATLKGGSGAACGNSAACGSGATCGSGAGGGEFDGRNGRSGRSGGRRGEDGDFDDPETAKGSACDWVFMNEANKFTLQQYLDLAANARKGVVIDYNPNQHFCIDDQLEPEEILLCSWQDNAKHLTPAQLEWFQKLKDNAMREGATAADMKRLDEFFQELANVARFTDRTEADIQIRHPQENCALINELKK
jgi:copper chaperone CopZ